jgi:hypothetical protein
MKKTLIICLVAFASLVLVYGSADAKVIGACVGCHTMHNSQNGATVYSGGPVAHLLNNSCLGCHTTSSLTDPYNPGVALYVGWAATLTNYTAGGYFTSNDGDNHSGNGHTYGSTYAPVGYQTGRGGGTTEYSGPLSCAGTNGCHGLDSIADESSSISGGHHGTSLYLGYRMLAVGTDKVLGTGASDYEEALNESLSTTNHNLYSGGDYLTATDTISKLCGTCHAQFHQDVMNTDSQWIRHPTDQAIPSTAGWEIYDYFGTAWTGNGAAYKNNPLGFVNVTESAANARVICLSCHRAHGSAVKDGLRWDYSLQIAGTSTGSENTIGCLGCHNKQR